KAGSRAHEDDQPAGFEVTATAKRHKKGRRLTPSEGALLPGSKPPFFEFIATRLRVPAPIAAMRLTTNSTFLSAIASSKPSLRSDVCPLAMSRHPDFNIGSRTTASDEIEREAQANFASTPQRNIHSPFPISRAAEDAGI